MPPFLRYHVTHNTFLFKNNERKDEKVKWKNQIPFGRYWFLCFPLFLMRSHQANRTALIAFDTNEFDRNLLTIPFGVSDYTNFNWNSIVFHFEWCKLAVNSMKRAIHRCDNCMRSIRFLFWQLIIHIELGHKAHSYNLLVPDLHIFQCGSRPSVYVWVRVFFFSSWQSHA